MYSRLCLLMQIPETDVTESRDEEIRYRKRNRQHKTQNLSKQRIAWGRNGRKWLRWQDISSFISQTCCYYFCWFPPHPNLISPCAPLQSGAVLYFNREQSQCMQMVTEFGNIFVGPRGMCQMFSYHLPLKRMTIIPDWDCEWLWVGREGCDKRSCRREH